MLIFPVDPIFGGPMFDSPRRDQLFGGNGTDYFVLGRDGRTDTIWNFEDGKDRIDLSAFEVQFDSVMIRQISELEWTIVVRDEMTRINFDTPEAGDPPIDLTEDDFIFASGVPAATPQVILDQAGLTHLHGTSLPDVFTMMIDTPARHHPPIRDGQGRDRPERLQHRFFRAELCRPETGARGHPRGHRRRR